MTRKRSLCDDPCQEMHACTKCGLVQFCEQYYRKGPSYTSGGRDRSNERIPQCKSCWKRGRWVGKSRPSQFAEKLKYRYHITIEQYEQMLADQDGGCAICHSDEAGGNGRWHIDHDHSCCPAPSQSCGKCVRGLLCHYCNVGLGNFKDNPENLMAAVDYLARRSTEVYP